jgi:hypothetical protein
LDGATLEGGEVGLVAGLASVEVGSTAGVVVEVADGSGPCVTCGGAEAVGTIGGTAVAVLTGSTVGETLLVGIGLGWDIGVGVFVGVLVGVLVVVLVGVLVG